jgi:phosphoribosylformylglycinamidine synthase
VYERPFARPGWQDALQADGPDALPRAGTPEELHALVLRMIASPNLADKSWITSQYDRFVQGNTALAMPEDAGMVRIDEETGRGVALSTDCNGRFAKLDPYTGAKLALAESYRNVAATGAVPLAVTNCLNFGSPEDPSVMWQFAEAARGLADGCAELGTPVTGGNVSFYNQTGDDAILPTPVVGVLGVIDDVARRTPMAWGPDGELIYLLGATREEFAGSEWAHVVHGHLGGLPPAVDLAAEKVLAEILVAGSRDGMLTAAHDVSDGGVIVALVEMALRAGVGARCWVADDVDPFTFSFAESAGRAVVVVPRSEELRFTEMCAARGYPYARIGVVDSGLGGDAGTDGQLLQLDNVWGSSLRWGLDELREAHRAALPALLEGH